MDAIQFIKTSYDNAMESLKEKRAVRAVANTERERLLKLAETVKEIIVDVRYSAYKEFYENIRTQYIGLLNDCKEDEPYKICSIGGKIELLNHFLTAPEKIIENIKETKK